MNNWNFTGNLGGDPEQRKDSKGDTILSFSVGVKSGFGDKATTTWPRCSMFGKRADAVAQYLAKGQLVGVSGEVNNREWSDKDGQKRLSLEVRVNDLTLLGKRDSNQEKASGSYGRSDPDRQPAKNAQGAHGGGFDDEDIPFSHHGAGRVWRVL
jgi:single-strand DNA-binding protein